MVNLSSKCFKEIDGSCLLLESFTSTHLEFGAELALQLRESGNRVGFCYVPNKVPLPDCRYKFEFIRGIRRRRRINNLLHVLQDKGVELLESPKISSCIYEECKKFSNQPIEDSTSLQALNYKGAFLGMSVLSTILSLYRITNLNIKAYEKEIRKRLLSSAIIYEKTLLLINNEEWEYCTYMNGRSGTTYPIHYLLRNKSSKKVYCREVFFKKGNAVTRLTDLVVHDQTYIAQSICRTVKGENFHEMEKIARKFYLGKFNLDPRISKMRSTQNKKIDNKEIDNNITFFSSSDDEYLSIKPFQSGSEEWSQFEAVKILYEIVLEKKIYHLNIRLHPNLLYASSDEIDRWKYFINKPKVSLYMPQSKLDSLSLLSSSLFNITWGSSLTELSSFLKKQTIMLCNPHYQDLNLCDVITNKKDLSDRLDNTAKDVEEYYKSAVELGFWRSTEGMETKYLKIVNKNHDLIVSLKKDLTKNLPLIKKNLYLKYFNQKVIS